MIIKRILWGMMATFASLIAFVGIPYFIATKPIGILRYKSAELLANTAYNLGFKAHIVFGGIALLMGWVQFSKRLRAWNLLWHRTIGTIYVVAVLVSGSAGLGIAPFATGGFWNALGFMTLDCIWLGTTAMAYFYARRHYITAHQAMMTYSYAACFGAVTLRLWMPILMMVFRDFAIAYSIVAWLSWIPNVIVAYFLVRRLEFKGK